MVLAIHLKRFKFMDHMKQHVKLDYRVVFPKDLRLSNAVRVNICSMFRSFNPVDGCYSAHCVEVAKFRADIYFVLLFLIQSVGKRRRGGPYL